MNGFAKLNYKWRAAIVVGLGLFLSVLDSTVVSVALPAMRRDFSTDFNTITWVVSAYFLAQAAVIPIMGYISDRAGTKVVFLTALGIFVMGSLLCTVAPTKEALIAARVVQGIGGGALFPTSFAIAYRAFPRDEWGRATAIIGMPVLVAPSLGPVIGGYLTSAFTWRAIFLINLPIGLIALGLAAIILRTRLEDAGAELVATANRFDVAGLVLSILGFTSLVYGLTEAGINGWGNAIVVRSLLAAGVILVLLIVVELRVDNPVLDMRIFRHAAFSKAILLIWIVAGFYYGSLFLIPFFFEKVEGLSALTSGEIMVSQGVAAAVGIALGGELYNKLGPRLLATVGTASLALSGIGFTHLGVATTGLSLQAWLALRGLGLGITSTPLQNLALSVVDRKDLARGTSLVNVTRQVASAAGVAALTAYVAQQAAHHASVTVASLHTARPSGIAATCAVDPATLAGCIQRHATTSGLNDAFFVGLVGCSAAVILALMVGRDPSVEALKGEAIDQIRGVFPQLGREQLVEVASRSRPLSFGPQQIIVRQGDRADHFYVITRGEVQVSQQADSGGTVEIGTLRVGQCFGEMSLLSNVPRTATVTAATQVELLALNQATFADLMTRSPETADDVRRIMEERLGNIPGATLL